MSSLEDDMNVFRQDSNLSSPESRASPPRDSERLQKEFEQFAQQRGLAPRSSHRSLGNSGVSAQRAGGRLERSISPALPSDWNLFRDRSKSPSPAPSPSPSPERKRAHNMAARHNSAKTDSNRFQTEFDTVMQQCSAVCAKLLQSSEKDVLDSVGIMLSGCVIDNQVIGGPAYSSQRTSKGDEIIEVDGQPVTQENILQALIGSDKPGSLVTLTIRKPEHDKPTMVTLRRMSSERIADRRLMFEIFTEMKSRAESNQDGKLAASIDECIELWTKMLIVDAAVNQTVVENVRDFQKELADEVVQLQQLHGVLNAVYKQDIASRDQGAQESEASISEMELQLKDGDDLILHLEEALAFERSNAAERENRLSKLENHIHGLSQECEECKKKDEVIRVLNQSECKECLRKDAIMDKYRQQLEMECQTCGKKDATIEEQQATITDLQASIKDLEGTCKEGSSLLFEREKSMSSLQGELEELKSEHEFWKTTDEQRSKAERKELQFSLSNAESEREKLLEEIIALKEQIRKFETENVALKQAERELQDCKVIAETLENEYKALLAEKEEAVSTRQLAEKKAEIEAKARVAAEYDCEEVQREAERRLASLQEALRAAEKETEEEGAARKVSEQREKDAIREREREREEAATAVDEKERAERARDSASEEGVRAKSLLRKEQERREEAERMMEQAEEGLRAAQARARQAELDLAAAEGGRDRAVARADGLERGLHKAEADKQAEMALRKELAEQVESMREANERAEKLGREESAARVRAEEAARHEEAMRSVAEDEKQKVSAKREQVETEMRSVRDEHSKALDQLDQARKALALERKKAERADAETAEEARARREAEDQQKQQAEIAKREAAARRIAEHDLAEAIRREESVREAVQRADDRASEAEKATRAAELRTEEVRGMFEERCREVAALQNQCEHLREEKEELRARVQRTENELEAAKAAEASAKDDVMAQRRLREKADNDVTEALNKLRAAEHERQRALALCHQADERALSEAKAKTKAEQNNEEETARRVEAVKRASVEEAARAAAENAVRDEQMNRQSVEEENRRLLDAIRTSNDEKDRAIRDGTDAKEALLKAEEERRRAVVEAHKAREEAAAAQKQVAQARADEAEATRSLRVMEGEVGKVKLQLELAGSKVAELRDSSKRLEGEVLSAVNSLNQAKNDAEAASARSVEAERAGAQDARRREAAEKRTAEAQRLLKEMEGQLEVASAARVSAERSAADAGLERRQAWQQVDALQDQLRSEKSASSKAEAEAADAQRRSAQNEADAMAEKRAKDAAERRAASLAEQLQEYESMFDGLRKQTSELDRQKCDLQRQLDETTHDKIEAEQRLRIKDEEAVAVAVARKQAEEEQARRDAQMQHDAAKLLKLERELESLKAASLQQGKEKGELAERLKGLERQLKTLDAEKRILDERLEGSERECKAAETAKKKNMEQAMNLEYQTAALESEKKRLTEAVEMKQRQLDSAELEQKVLREQVDDVERRVASLQSEGKTLRERAEELDGQKAESETENRKLKGDIEELKANKGIAETEQRKLREQLDDLLRKNANLESRQWKLVEQVEDLERQKVSMETETRKVKQYNEELERQKAAMVEEQQRQREKAEVAIQTQAALEASERKLKIEKEGLERQRKAKEEQLREREMEVHNLQRKLTESEGSLTECTHKSSELQDRAAFLNRELTATKQAAEERAAVDSDALARCNEELRKAKEEASDKRLELQRLKTESDIKEDHLSRTNRTLVEHGEEERAAARGEMFNAQQLNEQLRAEVRALRGDLSKANEEICMMQAILTSKLQPPTTPPKMASSMYPTLRTEAPTEGEGFLLKRCRALAVLLQKAVLADILSVDVEITSPTVGSRSTVGMMMSGQTVDNILLGGPAYNSQHARSGTREGVKKGDRVTHVDGKAVNDHNVVQALIGTDIPGTVVRVALDTYGGVSKVVELKRMPSEMIADKRRMFELFAKIKSLAQMGQDHVTSIAETVDECIDLWTRMLIAEAVHDNQIVDNVTRMEDQCNAWLMEQIQSLDVLLGTPSPGMARSPSGTRLFDPSMYPVRETSPRPPSEGSTDSFSAVLNDSFKNLFHTIPRSPGAAASNLRSASSKPASRRQALDSNGKASSRHPAKASVSATRARLSPSDLQTPHSAPLPRTQSSPARSGSWRVAASPKEAGGTSRNSWKPVPAAARSPHDSPLVCYPLFDLSPRTKSGSKKPLQTDPESKKRGPKNSSSTRNGHRSSSSSPNPGAVGTDSDSDSDKAPQPRTSSNGARHAGRRAPAKPDVEYVSDQYLAGLMRNGSRKVR